MKRSVPIQFGLAPVVTSAAAAEQARVVYYLLDSYGLASVISYLEAVRRLSLDVTTDCASYLTPYTLQCLKKKRCTKPDPSSFDAAVKGHNLRKDKESLGLKEVLKLESLHSRLESARKYGRRLGIESAVPPVFVNGVAIPRSEVSSVDHERRRIHLTSAGLAASSNQQGESRPTNSTASSMYEVNTQILLCS